MQPKLLKTKQRGRKRKLEEIDNDLPATKRLKTTHISSPKANNNDVFKQELQSKYHTKFSWTFFKFWQWIQQITQNKGNPLHSLKCLNITLVGPFEYLNGDLNNLDDNQILTHYRYYFDLPEFQTIIIENNNADNLHYGFWRDDANFNPVGIVQSNGTTKVIDKVTKMVQPVASNLFFLIRDMISNYLSNNSKNNNKDEKENDADLTAQRLKLLESLNQFIKSNKIKMTESEKLSPFKKREKNVVCKTFNGFGLVVPVKNDIGYREIGYTLAELKRIFKRMHNAKKNKKKIDAEEMEIILTNVCLADDEGDPGMGYELGIDFFYSYPMFQDQAKRLLMNAYNLTNRDSFKIILNAHFEERGKEKGNYNKLTPNKKEKKPKKKQDTNNNNNRNNKPTSRKITNFFRKSKKESNYNTKQDKNVKTKTLHTKTTKNTLDELSSDSE